MENKFILYSSSSVQQFDDINIIRIPLKNRRLKCEKLSFIEKIARFYFSIISPNGFIYYYIINGEIAHSSIVSNSLWKFPFINKDEFVIGPCYTFNKFRNQGIYGKVIRKICSDLNTKVYIFSNCLNIPSIKGIEKTNYFVKIGFVYKNFLKRYKKIGYGKRNK